MPFLRDRTLSARNIDRAISEFDATLSGLGTVIANLDGIPLLVALKRTPLTAGPYQDVTLFEAANRIMTDLVVLYGIKHLLSDSNFPYTEYTVEFGNEDNNGNDVSAQAGGRRLAGEAFNVAPSFFQGKRRNMARKLARARAEGATDTVLLFNDDAVRPGYQPAAGTRDLCLAVDVIKGIVREIRPRQPTTRSSSKSAPA